MKLKLILLQLSYFLVDSFWNLDSFRFLNQKKIYKFINKSVIDILFDTIHIAVFDEVVDLVGILSARMIVQKINFDMIFVQSTVILGDLEVMILFYLLVYGNSLLVNVHRSRHMDKEEGVVD